MKCRHCSADLTTSFIDLGSAPPSNAYLTEQDLRAPEKWFPLRVLVCTECWLVQTEDYAEADELFDADYAYFSSFSTTWLAHAERYVAEMTDRFGLNAASDVVEVAANDGYLLQYVKDRGIPCLGVEPTAGTAAAARGKGIAIIEDFFGVRLAGELAADGSQADLTVANNVLAHVPDINDFVAGFAVLLKPEGVATFEFPHLLRLVAENQFDTIYHEHFSYLSLHAVKRIFEHNGLTVFEIEELPTHGGSLRIYAKHAANEMLAVTQNVQAVLAKERGAGLFTQEVYQEFAERVKKVKRDLLSFLIEAKNRGKSIAAYGAPAKGNMLLNYCGIRTDFLDYTVDRSPHKQGKYLPGSKIPIFSPDKVAQTRPDYLLILPWNIKEEIMTQMAYVRQWGGKFVTAIPDLKIY
jgi:SAM-dependent methyltransferase